jgi:hypothetical protein
VPSKFTLHINLTSHFRCNADISVNVWQWNEQLDSVAGHSAIAHSCRNFNKIKDWARERRIHEWIDEKLHVDDDLEIPVIYS